MFPGPGMEGSISGVSMAISSGWNRLILEALREGRTLIVPALPACQAGMGYTHHPFNAFMSFLVQVWKREAGRRGWDQPERHREGSPGLAGRCMGQSVPTPLLPPGPDPAPRQGLSTPAGFSLQQTVTGCATLVCEPGWLPATVQYSILIRVQRALWPPA